jgi:hypothetical protein
MWLWTGVAYHWVHFASINPAAVAFGALFVIEGGLLLGATRSPSLLFRWRPDPRGIVGTAFVAYAGVLYPVLGIWSGHTYPRMPMFGIAPCPLTIFTFGLLLNVTPPPRRLLVIPITWSLIGGTAAILLQVPEDWGLIVSGMMAILSLFVRRASGSSALEAVDQRPARL